MTFFNSNFQFLTLNRIFLIKKLQLYQFDLINTCYFKMTETNNDSQYTELQRNVKVT